MVLCEICLKIDFVKISQLDTTKLFRVEQGRIGPYYVARELSSHDVSQKFALYHEALDSLHASAKSCDLCSLVHASVESRLNKTSACCSNYELRLAGRGKYDGFQVIGFDKDAAPTNRICELLAGVTFCVDEGQINEYLFGLSHCEKLTPDLDSQLSHVIQGRCILSRTKASTVIKKMNSWLEHCISHHDHENRLQNFLPSRILHITEDAKRVVLRFSNEICGKYAALSYCWGSTQTLMLTASTVERLRNGIETCILPKTYQDAVWVAQQLKISYLWIDSLCIIQDDPIDWMQESGKMSDIYSNSTLTISACRATNSEAGFLSNRSEQPHAKLIFCVQGIKGEVFALPVLPEHIAYPHKATSLEHEPLTSRGWALQERYLSPRLLHFCDLKLYFECDNGFYAEDLCFDGHATHPSMFVLHDYETNYGEHCREDWRRIVVEYSRRNLSVESDKLPALAGLAARFSLDSIHNGTSLVAGNRYLAGLWLDDMIRDLCWSLDIYKQPILRPQQYCAPSWSWASVNGPIDYKEWARFFTELAVLKDAYVNLESRDQAYGRVIGGWILLRGLKLRPYKKQDSKSLWIRDNGVVFRVVSTWDSEAYEVPEEGQLPYPDGGTTELFLIPLGWVKRHTLALNNGPDALLGPFFLIVKPATHEAQRYACVPGFKRVGFGTGVWLTNANEGTDKAGLERLIVERFFAAKQRGELEDIVLI